MTRSRLGLACGVVLAVSGCATTPPEKDPVQIKLNDLDTRLARIERVVENQSLLDLANQIEAARSDVRSLHNDFDQLSNELQVSRKQQKDLYADLDHRVKALELRGFAAAAASGTADGAGATGAPGVAATGSTVSAAAGAAAGAIDAGGATLPVPGGSDRENYQAAFALLKDSQYDQSIKAFQQFIAVFPDSSLADNAQYWLGEAYYVNKDFTNAATAFQTVIDKYPQSRKLADALLKIGYCAYELKQWDQAKLVLGEVVAKFSDTPAGRLAQQRLEKIETEKH